MAKHINTNFLTKKQAEDVARATASVASFNAKKTGPDTSFLTPEQAAGVQKATQTVANFQAGGNTNQNPIMAEIQKQLLKTSGLVSSGASGIQQQIADAISSREKGLGASTKRIESQFNREIGFQSEQFAQKKTSIRESQRGFATNVAALQQLDQRTEKSLRDLEQRKQELILAGESAAAGQISNLQVQSLQFQQKAQQQAFSNLLGIGQFASGLQKMQIEVQREARIATSQELSNTLAKERFDFQKTMSLEDQRQSQQRINILNAELKIKQLQEGDSVQPDPGFSDVQTQNNIGIGANALLEAISGNKQAGLITTREEEEAATISAYMKARRRFSKPQASDDALASMFGLMFDNNKELMFISGPIDNSQVNLPGENNIFSGFKEFITGITKEQDKFDKISKEISKIESGPGYQSIKDSKIRELRKKQSEINLR